MDPGSKIREKLIPDSGVKKAPDPKSGSTIYTVIISGYEEEAVMWLESGSDRIRKGTDQDPE
jgi:hypothetical protein